MFLSQGRQIILEKKSLCDDWLEEIGKKCPTTLSLEQCRGARVSSVGLRSLFRACSASLEELNVSGCSQGELTGDSILLHATRCPNLSVIDASWCNVSDNGVIALVDSSQRLESVCLNGCQAITDEAVCALVEKHANSLEVLELFGCFNLTPTSILMAGSFCKNLRTLNIGQCYKLTDDSISQLATHLKNVECLDLRGCKQIKDDCVRKVVRKCPRLQSLVLANCPLITDQALVEIATYLSSINQTQDQQNPAHVKITKPDMITSLFDDSK
ncbi:F-box/LRR-repeat protein fbxl-1-like [Ptychodera flava]|uniref:F-box/LRR-repeat protein fbxl-1-like n=1 Tax=Ptychodera flava TaxID=63121 RepID=UPI00396A7390